MEAGIQALLFIAGGWCQQNDGCIASNWNPTQLPPHLTASLVHGSPSHSRGISCFDQASKPASGRGSHYVPPGTMPASCPDGQRPNATAAAIKGPDGGRRGQKLSPVFEGEFGFELLHALPFMNWLESCGLLAPTTACVGMRPFYFFARGGHSERRCGTRPPRSRWRVGSLPRGFTDGWAWAGRHSLQFYAYPSRRWLPPPLHAHYRPLPLPPRRMTVVGTERYDRVAWRWRAWVQNKYYPEGHGTADNFWSLEELILIFDRLLAAGVQVVYNHPELALLGAADKNDEGKTSKAFQLGDGELIQKRYKAALESGNLLLLPELAKDQWSELPYNEVQLRVLAKSRCFLAPQGGASYLTFYQPGMHVVNDRTGKERCLSAQLASNGKSGTYWHYFTMLAGGEPSVIYNVNGNRTRLGAALEVMAKTEVCEVPDGALVL